mmetsp:Transcript_15067/g.28646  ORF Transcript_15067/g.28646 Transcript_15067/m.28646 type:complete len:240 (+) Transcript_15067:340-1059(+)
MLHALGTSHILGGVPYGLGQVGVAFPSPEFLVVDKAPRDLICGILGAPLIEASVLGYILPLVGVVVRDSVVGARTEELVRIDLGICLERWTKLEMPVSLFAVLARITTGVPISSAVIMGPPPLTIAIAHARDPIETELEVVINRLCKTSATEEFLSVDDELEGSLSVAAADTVKILEFKVILPSGEAIFNGFLLVGRYDRTHLHFLDISILVRDGPRGLLAELVNLGRDADAMSSSTVG